jgi:hypothetical protein
LASRAVVPCWVPGSGRAPKSTVGSLGPAPAGAASPAEATASDSTSTVSSQARLRIRFLPLEVGVGPTLPEYPVRGNVRLR